MKNTSITPSVTRTLSKRDEASLALMLDEKSAVKKHHDKMAKETAKKAVQQSTENAKWTREL
ncbi:hypothetical protein K3495_g12509 [Podosphaera aphanis]|nr:hypothetical protein K3495_g12509 [Podosphaera aphanis]